MKTINLRDLYPDVYKTDTFVEVTEEVLDVIQTAQRLEAAYERRMYRHKAHYSLDCGNGIEKAAVFRTATPEDIFEEKQFQEQVYATVMKLPEKQAMLKKTDIEPMVIEAIREIVRNEEYAQAIKKRIGVQIDTKAVDKELEGYQAKLKEVDLNKTRLEREIDSLPADAKYRERKLHDMTLRLDSLYDVIVELEEKIEDARLRRDAIKQQAITLENIYKIMVNFDCVYNIINDEEKRNVVTALIKEIEIYRNDESEYPLKRIGLNFPVFKDGGEVTELLWDKGNTVEKAAVLGNGSLGEQIQIGCLHAGFIHGI